MFSQIPRLHLRPVPRDQEQDPRRQEHQGQHPGRRQPVEARWCKPRASRWPQRKAARRPARAQQQQAAAAGSRSKQGSRNRHAAGSAAAAARNAARNARNAARNAGRRECRDAAPGAPNPNPPIRTTGFWIFKKKFCTQCEQQLDKTWDACPYCAQIAQQAAAAPAKLQAIKTQAFVIDAHGRPGQHAAARLARPAAGPAARASCSRCRRSR